MTEETSLRQIITKSTLANLVAGIGVLSGIVYFVYTKDTESLKWIAAICVGWLFKEKAKA